MNHLLRHDAEVIVRAAIAAVLPDRAVERALEGMEFSGRVFLVAAGKAAWQMSRAAVRCLKIPIAGGVCVTKYGHVQGRIPGVTCVEAGHPVPDENSFRGTDFSRFEHQCITTLKTPGPNHLFSQLQGRQIS